MLAWFLVLDTYFSSASFLRLLVVFLALPPREFYHNFRLCQDLFIFQEALGNPLGKSKVSLFDSKKRLSASVTTSAKGTFSFANVPPGHYYISFSLSGGPDAWYGGVEAKVISVQNTDVSITFTHPGGPSISGICLDPSGSPLGFSTVSLHALDEHEVASITARADGTFAFVGIQPGAYYIKFKRTGIPSVWFGGDTRQAVILGGSGSTAVSLGGR